MLMTLKSLSLVLVIISNMSVPICNRFYARRATSGNIRTFKEVDLPTFHALV